MEAHLRLPESAICRCLSLALLRGWMVVSTLVFSSVTSRKGTVLAVLFVACAPVCARALERVTLRSGFTVDCAHHEIVGDRVRLYTGNDSNYQDLSALQVTSIESLPDPPKPIVLPKPAVQATAMAAASSHTELGFKDILLHAGADHNIDVELLASVIHAESGYNPHAVSRAGARGLMQLMPGTGRTFGAHDLFSAEDNIAAGTAFLDELLKRYHDNLALALAAYNAGPAAVERYHGVPPFRETRAYVTRVINEFHRRKVALGATPLAQQTEASAVAPHAVGMP